MSALLLSALAAGSSGQGALYVDDVFSTYLYTGNGSTQTINNGIDLAGKGGLVWFKYRGYSTDHVLVNTVRGANKALFSSSTRGELTPGSFDGTFTRNTFISEVSSNGFVVGNDIGTGANGGSYVSWTFRKAPKFFDVVTYTGNGAAGRQIAHSLGVQAGFVTVKATSTTGDWNSYHRSATGDLKLNLTDAQTASRAIIAAADASTFTVSGAANSSGVSYVAYLWAHDPSADGIIQCGSFTTDGSGNATVNLGWEPQYVVHKASSGAGSWIINDAMRGMPVGSNDPTLLANSSASESADSDRIDPTATGFNIKLYAPSTTFIYLAIRRPNKPPTTGTEVYNASTASGVVSAGFPVDLHIGATRAGAANNHAVHSRLVGGTKELVTSSTAAEATIADLGFDSMTGLRASLSADGVNHFFRRAPGFFDVVCYTGTGVARNVPHNLTKPPELIIVKSRNNGALDWIVYVESLGAGKHLSLNLTGAAASLASTWNNTSPTSSVFSVGAYSNTNQSGSTYVAYLFASLQGISKVGSYRGNGSSQTIDCGFGTGARFVLAKRTDATGDWYIWDTARGIVAGNDPHLSLNSTAAEVTTDDSVDPAGVGFIVSQNAATNINVLNAQYIYFCVA